MSLRIQFIQDLIDNKLTTTELCRRYEISRKTAYKWLKRFHEGGQENLIDQSRKPKSSPQKIRPEIEEKILMLRKKRPAWGGKKLWKLLEHEGVYPLPSISTVNRVLLRNGQISLEEANKRKEFIRFEHASPNDLWQMDFKGHFGIKGTRCYPLTIIDDHSRFSLCLQACKNQTEHTVRKHLTDVFHKYGMPKRMTMDNGSPWGCSGKGYTHLAVWLMQLGIKVSHSRPFHPQTQGKDERFHRSFKDDLLTREYFEHFDRLQDRFYWWRDIYNTERPHEGISLDVPKNRYFVSSKRFPKKLLPVEYDSSFISRKVHSMGCFSFEGNEYFIGQAFLGQKIAIMETPDENEVDIIFNEHWVKRINLKTDIVRSRKVLPMS